MCGICGIASLDGSPIATGPLEDMNAALLHRGPDSSGTFVAGPVGLAMRRLSIIDLEGGEQPIANEDGRVRVIQNGEIYNHQALRADLLRRGHTFRTRSDTEVLVHLYEEEGPRFVERLRGMFALALWDAGEHRLVLARDRFGIKPLYYRAAGCELSFASELKALVRQPGFSTEIDLDAVEAFMAFNSVPAPLTIFAQARKLPAGHLLVSERGSVRLECYARPAPVPREEVRREQARELEHELLTRLRDSVRAHLVADVPVGVLLSGGIDSSALAALAALESPHPVHTFSIGFEEKAFNELAQARTVAERYGTEHHELVVRPDAVDLLPKIVQAFDEPFADSSALPTYLVTQLAANHVKVALSGEGGDELFGGYRTYVADLLAPRIGPAAWALRAVVERLPSGGRGRLEDRAKRFTRAAHLPALERHLAWTEIFSADARAELLRAPSRSGRDPLEPCRRRYEQTTGADSLARLQDVDLGVYLVDDLLVKTDRASMAHSLEVRVPFLDVAVTDLALSLPTRWKVRGLETKRLLRRAVAPLVPREVLAGPKRGFSIPAAAWLRGELRPLAREVLGRDRIRRQGYFNPAAVDRVLEAHLSGREDMSRQLWGLISFSLWIDNLARLRTTPLLSVGEP